MAELEQRINVHSVKLAQVHDIYTIQYWSHSLTLNHIQFQEPFHVCARTLRRLFQAIYSQ